MASLPLGGAGGAAILFITFSFSFYCICIMDFIFEFFEFSGFSSSQHLIYFIHIYMLAHFCCQLIVLFLLIALVVEGR